MEDLTGKQLGPYRVVAPLGEGGMAAVYKAYQPGMDRYVALKILPRHLASEPQFVKRFHQEAKVIAKLQHPHILPVFDFGEADGYTYIVMPLVEYGTLAGLRQGYPLPLKQIRSIVAQVGDALDYAHSHGIVHRDVKPSNVLIDERGNCMLTDFGIAKIVEGTAKLTTTGGITGTPAYMSPEQGLGQKIDKRSDIYALGVVLYEMATGRVPFTAETPMAIVIKHINDPLPPPRTVNPAISETAERVILKALAKTQEDRYQTAGAMVEALNAESPVLERYDSTTKPVIETMPRGEVVKKPRPAVPVWAWVAAVVGVAAVGGGVWFGLTTRGGLGKQDATQMATVFVAEMTPTAGAIRAPATVTAASTNTPRRTLSSPTLTPTMCATVANPRTYAWEFETAGDSEGWGEFDSHDIEPLQVTGGLLLTRSTGRDPHFFSPPRLRIDAASTPVIAVRMSVSLGGQGQLFFTTNAEKLWGETKSLLFDVSGDNRFHTYILDMSSVSSWRCTVTGLRLDPTGGIADIQIADIQVDYIRVQAP
ncbi:MAG: serine/threonine protein kinase [Chloroflexi bacterium]|nr:serine/threonine protein kinase [Chloroflexota bacterium]